MIIFDECERKKEETIFIKKYVYARRCIRCLELIGIFMGTNANMANFIKKDLASGSDR